MGDPVDVLFAKRHLLINLWDTAGNRLVINGKHYWIDYFKEEKERFNISSPPEFFDSISWDITLNGNRFDSDTNYYENISFNDDESYPLYVDYYFKEADGKFKVFFYFREKEKDYIGMAKFYSCDSILIQQYEMDGSIILEKIIDYDHYAVGQAYLPLGKHQLLGCE